MEEHNSAESNPPVPSQGRPGCEELLAACHTYLATFIRLSAVMPTFSMTRLPGALSPNWSTPTTLSAYLYHNPVTPASMATVFDLSGNTSALYASGCRSKRSTHGIDTTRVPGPSVSAAFTACCTSEPPC